MDAVNREAVSLLDLIKKERLPPILKAGCSKTIDQKFNGHFEHHGYSKPDLEKYVQMVIKLNRERLDEHTDKTVKDDRSKLGQRSKARGNSIKPKLSNSSNSLVEREQTAIEIETPTPPPSPASLGYVSPWEDEDDDTTDQTQYTAVGTDTAVGEVYGSDNNGREAEGKSQSSENLDMLRQAVGADVVICLADGDHMITAHSHILTDRNQWFAQKMKELEGQSVKILEVPDVDPMPFLQVVSHVYTGDFKSSSLENTVSVIRVAHNTNTTTLVDKAFEHLVSSLEIKTACLVLELTHTYEQNMARSSCLNFIYQHAQEIFLEEEMGHLCRKCITDIVKSDDLKADEIKVLNSLYFWALCEAKRNNIIKITPDALRTVLADLFYHVRFPLISISLLNENRLPFTMLQKKEILALNDVSYGLVHRLPPKFVRKRRNYEGEHVDSRNRSLNIRSSSKASAVSKNPTRLSTSLSGQVSSDSASPVSVQSLSSLFLQCSPSMKSMNSESLELERKGFQTVQRFASVTGPFQMKGPEELTFRCSEPIVLRGLQLFGAYGSFDTYHTRMTVRKTNKHIFTQDNVFDDDYRKPKLYDCLFKVAVPVHKAEEVTISVTMKGNDGKATYIGREGYKTRSVYGVTFEFIDGKCGDISVGQIPGLIFQRPLNRYL
ncbi:BTBD6-like protein [Mya arenaria]|uniref:BTBD6-like protein n=1 Tax=Mya arenaria TaxID=6604 RepID=A0ABY7EFL5_MYAAR|nr:BTBD6-like protein [Mya arenaria]